METGGLHYAKGYRHCEEASTPRLIGPLRPTRSHHSWRAVTRESVRVSQSVIYGDGAAATGRRLCSGAPSSGEIYAALTGARILQGAGSTLSLVFGLGDGFKRRYVGVVWTEQPRGRPGEA